MKKLFLLTVCLLFITMVQAQVRSNNRSNTLMRRYGVKVGMNLSNMSNDMTFDPEFSMGTGFQVGGFINFHWGLRTASSLPGTGLWGVQPELLYSHQTVKCNGGNINFNYIKLPVMFKVYPLAALSIEAGPEFSYLFSASPNSINFNEAVVTLGDCKGFDFGFGVGAAYELELGLVVGVRYSMGTKDLGKNLKWKNNCNLQITAGWLF